MTPDREPEHASDRDRDAVDQAFAELVAGYHLTADRPEAPPGSWPPPESRPEPRTQQEPDAAWADDHPLFRYTGPEDHEPTEEEERAAERQAEGHYEPPPPAPVPRPAWPVLLGWLGMGYALLVVLAVVVGIALPSWASWLALLGFVGGFGILVACLPRSRPPDDDGAVV